MRIQLPPSPYIAIVLAFAMNAGFVLAQSPNQIVAIGFDAPYGSPKLFSLAPGEVVPLFTPPLGVTDASATQTPLPTSLSGVSVLVQPVGANDITGYPTALPILDVHSVTGATCSFLVGPPPLSCGYTQITVQIPVELVCVLTVFDAENKETCGTAAPAPRRCST